MGHSRSRQNEPAALDAYPSKPAVVRRLKPGHLTQQIAALPGDVSLTPLETTQPVTFLRLTPASDGG